MAATNYTPIYLYNSGTTTNVPLAANLGNGELAINYTDGKLFYKDNTGTVQTIASKATGSVGGSTTQVQYNLSGALAGSSSFTWDGTSLSATNYVSSGTITASSSKGVYSYGTLGYSDVNHILTMQSSQNGYIQMEIQNTNNGASASADVVVTNNLSTATTYYGDFGINSSGFSGTGSLSGANNVYLTSTTSDLAIGTTTSNAIHFVVNSGASDAMTISSAGVVSLGTALAPTSGGTGVANNAASTITISGNYASTFVVSGAYSYTFPAATDTLVNLGSSQTLTNKTLTNPTITSYLETAPALTNSSTAVTLSLSSGTVLSYTLTGNCTFTMPTATSGTSFILKLIQDGTGSRTATFTGVKWPGGTAPTITTTASTGLDILSFVCINSVWYGTYAQAFA